MQHPFYYRNYHNNQIPIKIIDFILKHFLLRTNNLKEKYGDGFALITGGSSGIGLSFAKELLKINYKICLLSSNIKKLEKAQKELLAQYPKSTIKIIEFDLSQFYTEEAIKI